MNQLNSKKRLLASLFKRTGLNAILAAVQNRAFGPHARVINYHDISSEMLESFEQQLRYFRQRYLNVGRSELDRILRGDWKEGRPGLVITFDDGLRSHAEYAAPLLEKHGFTGWFFVPTKFVDAPAGEQRDFATQHSIAALARDDERLAMTWDEIRDLDARGHVIGSHTLHHARLGSGFNSEALEAEIVVSKKELEGQLRHEVDVFCWVGGEESSYSQAAASGIRQAGYRLSFMTNNFPIRAGDDALQIQRTNIEAWYPDEILEFQLNGLLDILYAPKRRRVNRLTG